MNDDITEEVKMIKLRGAANPYVGLEQAIVLADQLKKAVGRGPFGKEVAARGLNHESASGPALGKIAALVHFGLLERKGNVYSISNLAERILLPTSDGDRTEAVLEAAKKPKLYKQLIEKYQNQALPLLLNNILVRDFGINEKRSNDVTKNFKKSLEFAGILENGVIVENTTNENVSSKSSDAGLSQNSFSVGATTASGESALFENSRHEYSLSGSRKILISYPSDYTSEEARSIKSFAEYLISVRGEDQT